VPVDNKIVCDNVGALDHRRGAEEARRHRRRRHRPRNGLGLAPPRCRGHHPRSHARVPRLADQDVAKEALKVFTKQGLNISLGVTIGEVKVGKKGVSIAYKDKDGAEQKLEPTA
jgi:dihydrolipoamide dehydrogenase